jgi:hypothetical protein
MATALVCALALTGASAASAAVNLSSTFASNNEGWGTTQGSSSPGPATYDDGSQAITFTDADPGMFAGGFIAPWSGDATDNYGGTLSFKLKSSAGWNSGVVASIFSTTAQDGICFQGDPVGTSFATYSFTLDTSDALDGTCNAPASEAEIVEILSTFDGVFIAGEESDDTNNGFTTTLDDVSLGGGGTSPPYDVERELSLSHEKIESPFVKPHLAFTGAITSPADECNAGMKVVVYRRQKGPDMKLGTRTTDGDGGYRLSYPKKKGTYYAKTPAADLGLPQCLPVTSDPLKIT